MFVDDLRVPVEGHSADVLDWVDLLHHDTFVDGVLE
jgi:hypothetical protein